MAGEVAAVVAVRDHGMLTLRYADPDAVAEAKGRGGRRIDHVPCGSGWTGDRCSKRLGHRGAHSNESRRAR